MDSPKLTEGDKKGRVGSKKRFLMDEEEEE